MNVPPLGLYIHLPWCVRKCPYCDFNSHKAEGSFDEEAYVKALFFDLDQELTGVEGRAIETVFFGGGTPSLFSGKAIDAILSGVRSRLNLLKEAEITLEANPGTFEQEKFEAFRSAGVNRLSIGVQSFQPEQLKRLGRIHGQSEALEAFRVARSIGFESINLDLMFGLPEQTLEEALMDVQTALRLLPSHISYYQLTLEPNTLFHKYPPRLPGDEKTWMIQEAAQDLLGEAGYSQYEVSAYARPLKKCRHNQSIWEFGDYLGIGAGAHGKISQPQEAIFTRTAKIKHPQHYIKAAEERKSLGSRVKIDPKDLPFEFLMNALRLRSGFQESLFEQRTGLSINMLEPLLSQSIEEGLMIRDQGRIHCSKTGFHFLDTILQRFLP
ncbi:MAG: oxygen-independent coproporphyrinogen III oxidase-like protein [Gammaproteobacteria bacterium]|nr:oxygen-independent coproporphyrinogen III oxidase-like protein [Gammaproteobacteria bacterium]NBT45743.1 oxygen-independent coproporphyrinogen III oxidase-like protein [Gammaproteobacteria bacterium]NBY21885.1 oxygen-independent coproporphyrinogen III oxidase-like protein [Gammaproteobacteria bacterium]